MARIYRLLVFAVSVLSAAILLRSKALFSRVLSPLSSRVMSTSNGSSAVFPKNPAEWRKALEELPSTPEKIPAFFFGHGSPALIHSGLLSRMGDVGKDMGPNGPLATFLKDFGPALLAKYKPKGIVVFSAHWETHGERLGTSSMPYAR